MRLHCHHNLRFTQHLRINTILKHQLQQRAVLGIVVGGGSTERLKLLEILIACDAGKICYVSFLPILDTSARFMRRSPLPVQDRFQNTIGRIPR
jgi:hypothetical protein